MSEHKEFQGKSLDAAIAEACAYYDLPREKLEIDIVQDAKSGIFGLVGARKAIVRARRAQLPELGAKGKAGGKSSGRGKGRGKADAASDEAAPAMPLDESGAPGKDADLEGEAGAFPDDPEESEDAESAEAAPSQVAKGKRQSSRKKDAAGDGQSGQAEDDAGQDKKPGRSSAKSRQKPDSGEVQMEDNRQGRRKSAKPEKKTDKGERSLRPPLAIAGNDGANPADSHDTTMGYVDDAQELSLPRVPLAELDQDRLRQTGLDVILTLIRPIVGDMPVDITIGEDRLMASVSGDDTGLLIGREGQNLAAVQYLAARIISRMMGSQVRVQVDAGDYHSRQDNRLRELAHNLAEKVRTNGKSMSTKPLSAYQRRVIHLSLQDDPDIYTRSSGDGAMKRVIVMRRKDGNGNGNGLDKAGMAKEGPESGNA